MRGRRLPSPADCDVLAYHLKDPSIYALAGHPTPDPLLLRIKMEWDDSTEITLHKTTTHSAEWLF